MTSQVLEFTLAARLMELTPGPNMTWLALLSAQHGRRTGLTAVAGIGLGLALLAAVAAVGATSLLTGYPLALEALRWAGAVFLFYLAFEAWVGEHPGASGSEVSRSFWRAVIVNLLNPKAALLFVVLVPGFLDASQPLLPQTILLSTIYVAIATAVHSAIAVFAGSFQHLLMEPGREIIARRVCAGVLVVIAVWFLLTSAP
jgi:threonine/homoserine/homoserine lactone efflux protein